MSSSVHPSTFKAAFPPSLISSSINQRTNLACWPNNRQNWWTVWPNQSTYQLAYWPTCRLIYLLTDCMTDLPINRLTSWPTSTDRTINSPTDLSRQRLIYWPSEQQNSQTTQQAVWLPDRPSDCMTNQASNTSTYQLLKQLTNCSSNWPTDQTSRRDICTLKAWIIAKAYTTPLTCQTGVSNKTSNRVWHPRLFPLPPQLTDGSKDHEQVTSYGSCTVDSLL